MNCSCVSYVSFWPCFLSVNPNTSHFIQHLLEKRKDKKKQTGLFFIFVYIALTFRIQLYCTEILKIRLEIERDKERVCERDVFKRCKKNKESDVWRAQWDEVKMRL